MSYLLRVTGLSEAKFECDINSGTRSQQEVLLPTSIRFGMICEHSQTGIQHGLSRLELGTLNCAFTGTACRDFLGFGSTPTPMNDLDMHHESQRSGILAIREEGRNTITRHLCRRVVRSVSENYFVLTAFIQLSENYFDLTAFLAVSENYFDLANLTSRHGFRSIISLALPRLSMVSLSLCLAGLTLFHTLSSHWSRSLLTSHPNIQAGSVAGGRLH